MVHRYRALLFDLDGTLVDSAPGICDSARAACRVMGVVEPDHAVVRPMIGLPLVHIARTLLGDGCEDAAVERWCASYREAFDRDALPNTVAFPDVPEELARWRAASRQLAIATSKHTEVACKVLARARLLDLFDVVVGGDQVEWGKPNPDLAVHTAALLGVAPPRAALVGDAAHDMLMARGAGLDAYGVTYGVHDRAQLEAAGATAVVDGFRDLAAFLG